MKTVLTTIFLLLSLLSFSQEPADSTITLVFSRQQMDGYLRPARIRNYSDTAFLTNLEEGAYLYNTGAGHVQFTIGNKGKMNGKSYIVKKTPKLTDSTVYETRSSRVNKYEQYKNGKLSLIASFSANAIYTKDLGVDGSYTTELDTLINGVPCMVKMTFLSNGQKAVVHDGIKNMDTTFTPWGTVASIESLKEPYRKEYNMYGRLTTHKYVRYTNKKAGIFDRIIDEYKYDQVSKRIIMPNNKDEVTTISFSNGVPDGKEVVTTRKNGYRVERIVTYYDKDGKVRYESKKTEPASEVIVAPRDN